MTKPVGVLLFIAATRFSLLCTPTNPDPPDNSCESASDCANLPKGATECQAPGAWQCVQSSCVCAQPKQRSEPEEGELREPEEREAAEAL